MISTLMLLVPKLAFNSISFSFDGAEVLRYLMVIFLLYDQP